MHFFVPNLFILPFSLHESIKLQICVYICIRLREYIWRHENMGRAVPCTWRKHVLLHDHATMEQVNFEHEEYLLSSYQTHLIITNSTLTFLPFIYIFVCC